MKLFTNALKKEVTPDKSKGIGGLHNSKNAVKSTAAEKTLARSNAFTKATNLSADKFPQTYALLELAVCEKAGILKTTNSDYSGGTIMALVASSGIRGRLSFFDSAVKEILKKNKNFEGTPFITFVKKDTNFNQMMYSIVKKYLSFYDNDEDIYDIVISAFTSLFLDNFKKAFHDFDGIYLAEGGREQQIAIEGYIYQLLSRAIVTESKKISKHLKDRAQITPFEGESEEDALDREVGDSIEKFKSSDQKLWDQLLKLLRDKMKSKRNYDILEKVLQHLLLGHSASEIAAKLGVSTTRIGDHVWYLKLFVQEVAKDLSNQGDSDMLKTLEKQFKMVK
jgi:hypothetical protein